MQNFRWKWVAYYAFGNLIVASSCLIMVWVSFNAIGLSLPPDTYFVLSLAAISIAVLFGLIYSFLFSKNLNSQLKEITVGVKTLAHGDLSFRLPFIDDGDLGEIASAFNEMADRIDNQVTSLQKLAEENEFLIQQAKDNAITKERQRLAQDLHDAVSQQLFAISLTSATAIKIYNQNPRHAGKLLNQIEQSANKAQREMRTLLLQLRPQVLENQPLSKAIRSLTQELKTKMTIECHLQITNLELPIHIENQVYRILQESLANVMRHSLATKVSIKLDSFDNDQRVYLIVEDNGVGFNPNNISSTSYGIRTIKERVSELGGTVEWISIPGKGTRLESRIPIRK